MDQTSATTPSHGDATPSAEVRVLRALLLFASLVLVAIWSMEARSGLIAAGDRIMYPLLIAVFSSCSVWLFWRPDQAGWPKAIANTMVIVHLVSTVHMVLFFSPGPMDLFKLAMAMFWMPLCYSSVFVFFPLRTALFASSATLLALTGPVVLAFATGHGARWDESFPVLMTNLALAQLTYVLMLLAIARLRSDYTLTTARAQLLQTLAVTDPLTGLPNRRALNELLAAQVALARRGAQVLSVILIDVDHFKQINDQHGHAAGDSVLVQLAGLLQRQARISDSVGRWGGEEFLVVASATSISAVIELAERFRKAVAEAEFCHGRPVTISLGLAQALPGDNIDLLLKRADSALYRAKRLGRNRIEREVVEAVG